MNTESIENILKMQIEQIKAADSKVSPLFAINIAMLGCLAALSKSVEQWGIAQAILLALATTPLLLSIIFLGISMFPRLNGPRGSMIFFGGITAQKHDSYVQLLSHLETEEYKADVASQSHRNAEIAFAKYGSIKNAFIATFLSVPFWLAAIFSIYA